MSDSSVLGHGDFGEVCGMVKAGCMSSRLLWLVDIALAETLPAST